MLIATLLHWDRFSHDQIAFYTWVVVYAITPFLVFAAWLNNRRTDPGNLEVNDIGWPRAARFILAGVGTANLVICLALFIQPALMVSVWPWNLTPLTARVVGSMFALQGVFGVAMALDPRWSAARIILETQFISMVFILIAVVRTWSTFDQTRAFTWVFVGSIVTILAALPVLYLSLEARRRKPS